MHDNNIFPESDRNERIWVPDERHPGDAGRQPKALASVNVGGNRHIANTCWLELPVDGYQSLIVDRIEHLMRPKSLCGSSTNSQRVLSGMFKGIDLILGAQRRAEFDLAANRLTRLERRDGEAVTAARKRLMGDLMIAILPAFEPYERRARWFLDIVNGGLDTDRDDTRGLFISGLSEPGLRLLLRTLCVDVRFAIVHSAGRSALEDKHGSKHIQIAEQVLDELWRPILKKRQRLTP